jgi:hypothetical protein
MFFVQPVEDVEGDVELGAVGVFLPTVCHCQKILFIMLMPKILIIKMNPIDTFPSLSISIGYISTLYHEILDNPVEYIPFIM